MENEIENVSRSSSAALCALASFPCPHLVASSAATANGSAVVENCQRPFWMGSDSSWMLVWTFVLLHCADGGVVHYFSFE
jgi:tryptophan-rich sensory protein